jgi:hypothetical protein
MDAPDSLRSPKHDAMDKVSSFGERSESGGSTKPYYNSLNLNLMAVTLTLFQREREFPYLLFIPSPFGGGLG